MKFFFPFFFFEGVFLFEVKNKFVWVTRALELAARKLSDPDVQIKISDTSKVVLEVSKMN